ncbi:MAG: hypothetical protein ACT4P4_07990 [Betaproteobacteria bacterium]
MTSHPEAESPGDAAYEKVVRWIPLVVPLMAVFLGAMVLLILADL